MTGLPIYSQLDGDKRPPFVWEGLYELLQIAGTIDLGSRFRKIPAKRRNSIENSGEWPLHDGRMLTIRNSGNPTTFRPEYILSISRPGGKGSDATVHSIVLKDTEFMRLRTKPEAMAGLRHITNAAQDALAALENGPLVPAELIRQATPAMLYRPPSAPSSHVSTIKMSHRTPWQDPRDILDEDGNIEYRPPAGGIANICVRISPFERSFELGAFTMMIRDPSLTDPLERMASVPKLEQLSSYGRPQ